MQEQANTICTPQNHVKSNINIKCVLTFMGGVHGSWKISVQSVWTLLRLKVTCLT